VFSSLLKSNITRIALIFFMFSSTTFAEGGNFNSVLMHVAESRLLHDSAFYMFL
jgi:hypothetical protein